MMKSMQRCLAIGPMLGLMVATAVPGQPASAPATRIPARALVAPVLWSGRYAYQFTGGRNAAGTGVTVSYRLSLAPGTCRFTAEGYQTDETVICSVEPHANAIDIIFKGYGDGKLTDRYGNPEYAVGDHLFSLEQSGGQLLTSWKGYPLPDGKPHPRGVYFKRVE